ncbi:MAG: hypothetical protein ACREHC_05470 [Candidatus Levyibacteriota bacterium]
MKVKCITNTGKHLSEKQAVFVNSPNYTREFLEVGKEYTIYGIMIFKNIIYYLIAVNQGNTPAFEPAEFFEILDSTLPPTWYYNYFGEGHAIWGYEELAFNAQHNVDLIEREKPAEEAFKIFYIRKNKIDEWEKNKTEN